MLMPEKSDIIQHPKIMAAMFPFRFQASRAAVELLVAL